jgi:small-conductance mechanosensitive channel
MQYVSGMTGVFPSPEKLFISKEEAKLKERDTLQDQLKVLLQESQQENLDGQQIILKEQITELKRDRDADPENEFLSKKLVLLGDIYQLNKDYMQLEERLIEKTKEQIKLLEEYLQDPGQLGFAQSLGLDHRVAYSFTDLRRKKEEIDEKKASLDLLQQQINNTVSEIKNREQASQAAAQAYKQKRDAYEKASGSPELFDLTMQHEQELANLEARMFDAKQHVDQLTLTLLRLRIKNLSTKRDIEDAQLQILKQVFNRIKQSSIRISEADVTFARDELEKKRQTLNAEKIDIYEPKKEKIKLQIIQGEQELDALSKKNNISLTDDITQWTAIIKPTPQARDAFLEVVSVYEQVRLERLHLEEIDAQLDWEDLKLTMERIDTEIKLSFYKIYAGKFSSEEKIIDEVKQYELKLSDIQANIAQLETKRTTVENQLSVAKKIVETIARLRQTVTDEKNSLYSQQQQLFKHALDLLAISEERVKQEIKTLNSLRSIYTDSTDQLKRMQQYIKFTIDELKASSGSIIWDRPEDAISWQGVKNIIPNLQTFAHDVRSYIRHFDLAALIYKIKNLFVADYALLYLLFYAILWIALLIALRLLLPVAIIRLHDLDRNKTSAGILFIRTFFAFLLQNYWVMAIWLSILLLLTMYVIPDPYPYIIFYLLSIPFLIYLVHRLIGQFVQVNIKHDYIFSGKEQQTRFIICLKTLLYATIIIFFLREAFILGNYAKSELPNILKALNIIILQISIIFLITKELVLSAIPRTSDMWLNIRQYVDQYYYLILMVLIAIIVMANPYVGFGRLVLFVLSRVMYTILLIGFLFWVHTLVKRWSSALFFQTDQETTKERFPSAKTWYGVAIIGILLSFIFLGAIIIAKIWQWPESLKNIKEMQDVVEWLKTPRLLVQTESPISVFTVLQFLFFLLAGVIVAAAVRRFVLNRIFDVLLVDSGIQNTVVSLTRYVIMLIAIMLGMNAIGLGTQINVMLGALLVGSAFIIKDPAADLFAYFIILVQRPIKIGDYIRLNSDVMGVVRKITARSVVLRRRNSTTIIVPNSYVVNNPIINWNYVRGFIAFDDIKIVIAYKEDPSHVKDVLERILDSSPYILKNPKPIVRLEEFGVHGYEYIMRGYISSNYTLDQWEIASAIRLATIKSLREHAIDIAVPIRMVVNYQGSLTDFTPKVDPVDGMKYE